VKGKMEPTRSITDRPPRRRNKTGCERAVNTTFHLSPSLSLISSPILYSSSSTHTPTQLIPFHSIPSLSSPSPPWPPLFRAFKTKLSSHPCPLIVDSLFHKLTQMSHKACVEGSPLSLLISNPFLHLLLRSEEHTSELQSLQ